MKAAAMPFAMRRRSLLAVVLAGLAGAGCASTPDATGAGGPANTGTYPNLNVPPPVSTRQFDDSSLQAHNGALQSARAVQDAEGTRAATLAAAGRTDQERLARLAAAMQADTRAAIESSASTTDGAGAVQRLREREAQLQAGDGTALSPAERERRRKLAAARQAELLKEIERNR